MKHLMSGQTIALTGRAAIERIMTEVSLVHRAIVEREGPPTFLKAMPERTFKLGAVELGIDAHALAFHLVRLEHALVAKLTTKCW